MQGYLGSALALALVATGAHAQQADEKTGEKVIVVTATGLPQDRDESGQAITVIDAADIETSQAQSVVDLLERVPSVRANSNGTLGSVTSVSVRGAEPGQTLVLLDGVRINDPSSTSEVVDFGNVLVGNIRRIEVMRGSNSIPYGSDAMGGVIDLSTRDPNAREGLSLRASAEGGYAGTASGAADLGWRSGELRIDGGIAGLRTDGISSTHPRYGAPDLDGLENLTGHIRIEAPITDGLSIDLRAYAVDATLGYDSLFGANGGPALNTDTSHFTQVTGYAGLNATSFGGALTSRLALTYLRNGRDYRYAPEDPVDFGYRGTVWRLDYQGKLALDPAADLLFGYTHDAPEYRFFGFGSDEVHRAQTDSGFVMLVLRPLPRLAVTGGVRHDIHSEFGGVTTFGANANWGLADGKTRVRLAYGEGFRTPSLYQLYDTYAGNPDLKPERSHSIDLGVDRTIADGRGRISFTVFSRLTRNQIGYENTYVNTVRVSARGAEVEFAVTPAKGLDIAVGYSLLDTRNRTPGSVVPDIHMERQPVHVASLSADKRWSFGLSLGATFRMVSDAVDLSIYPETLDGYTLLDLRASFPIGKHVEIFGRLDNAFDSRYETAYGYNSYGRAAYGGVRLKL